MALLAAGCGGKRVELPAADRVDDIVRGAAAASCRMFLPPEHYPQARVILSNLVEVARVNPGEAYREISTDGFKKVPAIGLVWSAIHVVLDAYAAHADHWIALAERSVEAAASGCLEAIAGKQPSPQPV